MTDFGITTTRLSLFGFLFVLVLAWFCYRPAFGGAFQLDDVANLADLAYVEDTASAVDFIVSGTAGPAGRPLALLTFAMQAEKWEQGASAFLRANVLIHLLNALLLAGCLFQLSVLRGVERHNAVMVAAAASSIWVMMPLLASASLLVVQRMTTLSALFMLLGLGGYLIARSRSDESPRRALIGMSASLAIGTLCATLCKESGLLLPTLILTLEATLLDRPSAIARRQWRLWQTVVMVVPTIAVVAYLASRASYPDWIVARRDFNVWERLLTEAQVLWLYLQKALIGIPSQLGIYQSAPAISRSLFHLPTLLACVSWLVVIPAAIAWRRRYPLFALAVLWYVAAHVLESSVLPLEVYFEYRNYLPIVGPLYAVCSYLLLGGAQLRRIAVLAVPPYLLLNAYFLYSYSSLSGEPSLASRYWALKYPDSVRAVTTMATYQLAEEGPIRTLSTIDRFANEQPQHAYLRIQELNLRCLYLPDENHGHVVYKLKRELPSVDFTYTAGAMLSQLSTTAAKTECKEITPDTVVVLAEALRSNPRYAINPVYNQFHHKLLAAIARQQGNVAATIDHLEKAIAQRPSSELNMMMVTTLAGEGDLDSAKAYIDAAMNTQPANPLRAAVWRRELEKLREYINEIERYSQSVK